MRKKKIRKKSKDIGPSLKAKAWKEFSIFIRRREADHYGITECFTCGTKKHWSDMQAGHYKHGKLDFDEMNVNVQCAGCNCWGRGKLDNYSRNLIKKHGLEAFESLHQKADLATKGEKMSHDEIEQIYLKYKAINESKP